MQPSQGWRRGFESLRPIFYKNDFIMKDLCILSDFDGTITTCDGLYSFISVYAQEGWKQIEQDWVDGKINSKKCLIEEFKLVPNLSEKYDFHILQ